MPLRPFQEALQLARDYAAEAVGPATNQTLNSALRSMIQAAYLEGMRVGEQDGLSHRPPSTTSEWCGRDCVSPSLCEREGCKWKREQQA